MIAMPGSTTHAELAAGVRAGRAEAVRRLLGPQAYYQAARPARTDPWRLRLGVRGGSAASHLPQGDRDRLIAASRDAWRNTPIGRAVTEAWVMLVAGDGYRPEPMTGDPVVDDELATRWQELGTELDVAGVLDADALVQVALRHALLDGDVLIRPVVHAGRRAVQLVDAERVRNPGDTIDDAEWRQGVRHEPATGAPIAYGVREWRSDGSGPEHTHSEWPVLGEAGDPMLFMLAGMAGQTRGEPMLAPVLDDLHRLADYVQSVEAAAHLAALVQFAHVSADPAGTERMLGAEATPGGAAATGDAGPLATLQPASVFTLAPGEDLKAVQASQPSTGFGDLVTHRTRAIAAAVGLPLELVQLDFSLANYSGTLGAIEAAMRRARPVQQRVAATLLKRVWAWVSAQWMAEMGLGERPARCRWRLPARLAVDPLRDAKTFELAQRTAMGSLRDFRSDWIEATAQIAAERELREELGVRPEITPGAGGGAGEPATPPADADAGGSAGGGDGTGADPGDAGVAP